MLHPLVEAIEQWHWGRSPEAVALAAANLRIVDPDHWLLQELAEKLASLRHEHSPASARTRQAGSRS